MPSHLENKSAEKAVAGADGADRPNVWRRGGERDVAADEHGSLFAQRERNHLRTAFPYDTPAGFRTGGMIRQRVADQRLQFATARLHHVKSAAKSARERLAGRIQYEARIPRRHHARGPRVKV